jgi:hypothetical protein
VFYELGCKKKECLKNIFDTNERKMQAAVVVFIPGSCKVIPIGEFVV